MTVPTLTKKVVKDLLKDRSSEVLGEGTYGRVHSVTYKRQKCVVKLGKSCHSSSEFEQEAELMAELEGAGGAPAPLGLCSNPPAILMTYNGSDTLDSYLCDSDSELSIQSVMRLALRITECLQEIHGKNIIHCDLKSNNVTLTFNAKHDVKSVHIIDFGFACHVGHRFQAMKQDEESDWYCSCVSTGEPISAECDLPGLGSVLSDLFVDRTDVPEDIVELVESCRSSCHEDRPHLDDVRERLASECRDYGFEVPRKN